MSTIQVGLLKNAFTRKEDGGPTIKQCDGITHVIRMLVRDCTRLSMETWHSLNVYCAKISNDFFSANQWSDDIFRTIQMGAEDIQSWSLVLNQDRFFGRKQHKKHDGTLVIEDRLFNQDFFQSFRGKTCRTRQNIDCLKSLRELLSC